MRNNVAVIGAGAWGTALAAVAARAGRNVVLQAREEEVVASISERHENTLFLPDVPLPETITATQDAAQALENADAVLMVVPAQFLRATCRQIRPHFKKGLPAVICCKGIEQNTGALLGEILAQELPEAVCAVLSGPTFAHEVAAGKPTALTLACKDEKTGWELIEALGSLTFRPYYTNDVLGVQIGGAVKNVLAIAAGIVAGKRLGDNARALLITRGLSELTRFCMALGGRFETMGGLSGLGDLLLTANSMQSRNFSLGVALGEGRALNDVLSERNNVTEGVYTASAVLERARKAGVEMPLCEALYKILYRDKSIDDALTELLSRPFRAESFESYH